jgi:hypothetical protein
MKIGRLRKIEARASEQDRPDERYSDNQKSGPEREKKKRRVERAAHFIECGRSG